MPWARLVAIRSYLPEYVLTNEELAPQVGWAPEEIETKTGIRERRIAAPGECVSDMAATAARRLLADHDIDPASIQFLILCTQTPDHLLPTTACLVQTALGLPDTCAAFDVNLGCSGYVYSLGIASAFIRGGMFVRGLVITADTYSKFIHPGDRSVRTLFGDAATATLVESGEAPGLTSFAFGTDGTGGCNLIIPAGGTRLPHSVETCREETDESGNRRSAENLYMNGPEILAFTLNRVPALVNQILENAGVAKEEIDWFVFHQANRFLLKHLRTKIGVPPEKMVEHITDVGNTVSSTIPLALEAGVVENRFQPGQNLLLVGFGVGYSWGASHLVWN